MTGTNRFYEKKKNTLQSATLKLENKGWTVKIQPIMTPAELEAVLKHVIDPENNPDPSEG